ncbi:hypothetical protein [Cellulomonas dongxiuzhuiae]|uniref:Uncharacterized protein n=1 Tax=Cellulomonas dongxiuzhuiae TaxID=2819979 RepID=A0ABX8GKI3_9CELL|nr:hypothetical protein [Cellulomonas dongxiuzhuiae]MBO3095484.1 hypothetical protein [Cellulomonas dongxiuzhuiae]QWC16465.1 hypothetical protein KKR89_01955 [Cellulomonas dongxiuzhuiae]
MSTPGASDGLAEQLAKLFVRHDPLEPWWTESHHDDSSWDEEALMLAGRLADAGSVGDVRALILAVLSVPFPGARVDDGVLRGDDIDALAEASWHLLCFRSDL